MNECKKIDAFWLDWENDDDDDDDNGNKYDWQLQIDKQEMASTSGLVEWEQSTVKLRQNLLRETGITRHKISTQTPNGKKKEKKKIRAHHITQTQRDKHIKSKQASKERTKLTK